MALTLSIANHSASLPIAYRLYLPLEWTADAARRAQAGVPEATSFAIKPDIALSQIRAAQAAGVAPGVVRMDAGYGSDTRLRSEIAALGLCYVAGIQPHATAWPPGVAPLPAKAWSGRGRPPSRTRRVPEHQPLQAKALALGLPQEAWQAVTWREGSADWLTSRFARVRVRAAHRDDRLSEPRPEEWLLIEWPPGEKEPTKYWFANLPDDISFEPLIDLSKLRWRIERDYLELQQELDLRHYEAAAGEASTITPSSASPPTAS